MAEGPIVLLSEHLNPTAAKWLGDRTQLWLAKYETPEFYKVLPEIEGLVVRTYTQVTPAVLENAPNLKVVGRAGVGLDNIDLAACMKNKVQVVYTPEANTQAVVEYIFEFILRHERPMFLYQQHISAEDFHNHRKRCIGGQLSQMTLGILGMGRIGRRMAQVAGAIGMRVLYNDLLSPEELDLPPGQPGAPVDLETLCRESDIFTVHIDGRSENRHFINADLLSKLKPTSLLINAARGMLVDAEALAAWAQANQGKGAAVFVDTHEPEPPHDEYPLYGLGNVFLSPHLASRTPTALENMSWVVKDVVAVLSGEEPRYPAFELEDDDDFDLGLE